MPARTGFRLFGRPVHAALYPAPRAQWNDPESVLGELSGQAPPPARLDPCFRAAGLFNGPVFAMQRIRLHPRLAIDCRPGWYFDSMNTCEKLELERRFSTRFPPRRLWRNGAARTAAIGISTVVAWPGGEGWLALAGRMQPKSMPHRAGQIHVIPSGMFSPPFSVTENVRRELAEEAGLALPPQGLRLAGIAVNLENLRPEICPLLALDRPPRATPREEFEPELCPVPLPCGNAAPPPALAEAVFAVPAAAALLLAARLLRCAGIRSAQ